MDNTKKLSEMLPEGMDDAVATEIAGLVSKIVNEQVDTRVKVLEAKVHGFLRSNVDTIKQHALTELVHENKDVRDAAMFREIKSLFVSDMDQENQLESVKRTSQDNDDLVQEVAALTHELTEAVKQKDKYRVANRALSGKVKLLSTSLQEVKESVESLQESRGQPFKSSERAQVPSVVREEQQEPENYNIEALASMINEESMKLMPFKNGRNK